MITDREKKIIELIEENPSISQQDLADQCGIARSSVAVHISNLMKKGIILGKGYIIHHEPYTLVIGGQNIDIHGRPFAKATISDSAPGIVRMSEGGVGRNIALNLARLDESVKFITAFGDDHNGELLANNARQAGIDISQSAFITNDASSTYLYITDETGEMQMAVSDMEIYRHLTPAYLESKHNIIKRASICIVDTNLNEDTIDYIAKTTTSPLFVDTVSTTKAIKVKPILDRVHTLKPNKIEAEILTGVKITDQESLDKAVDAFINKGLEQVFISLGPDGIYAANKKERVRLPIIPAVDKINTTGAGDAFVAGLAWAWRQNCTLKESALAGLAASSVCMESIETVSPDMSVDNLKNKMKTAINY